MINFNKIVQEASHPRPREPSGVLEAINDIMGLRWVRRRRARRVNEHDDNPGGRGLRKYKGRSFFH